MQIYKRMYGVVLVVMMGLSVMSCNGEQKVDMFAECGDKEVETTTVAMIALEETGSEETSSEETGSKESGSEINTYTEQTTIAPTTQVPTTETSTTTQSTTTTQAPTTTQTPTTTVEKETTTESKWIDTVREFTEPVVEQFKYGLIITTMYEYDYYVHSDGTRYRAPQPVRKIATVDTTGYNATDEQLMEEAKTQAAEYQTYFEEVLRLVNEIRAEAGVAPLVLDASLTEAACIRALEMDYTDSCNHYRGDERRWDTVLELYPELEYNRHGENIAAGIKSPEDVVKAWKESKSHYENMISPNYTKMGVGYSNECPAGYAHYWAQIFTD